MQSGNAVLVLEQEDNLQQLKVKYITDNDIPKTLNGESGFHIYHVRMLTELILRQLNEAEGYSLSDEEIAAIAVASSLHDIGKSKIPKSILDFPGKLSPLEYDIVKKHASFGEGIINACDFAEFGPEIPSLAYWWQILTT